MDPLDWLVVGGGPHGCHLAARLLDGAGSDGLSLRILDPSPEPMAQWRRVTTRVGMEFLRSPVVHHVGIDPLEVARFGRRTGARRQQGHFRGPQRRPSLALFNAHAADVADRYGFESRWIEGRAGSLRRTVSGEWRVEWDGGGAIARNVILALGSLDRLAWPEWASVLAGRVLPGQVTHLLDPAPDFSGPPPMADQPDLVVGAGMTGAQAALRLASEGRPVVLLARRAVRIARYDTEPGWLGPKYMRSFLASPDPAERRRRIDEGRNPGTVTADVANALGAAEKRGAVELAVGEVLGVAPQGDTLLATIRRGSADGEERSVVPEPRPFARIFLATGVERRRPGGSWLDDAIAQEGLPVAACGYPILEGNLAWAEGLYAIGALGELELGPVARNLAGARAAAERIAGHTAAAEVIQRAS